MSPVGVRAEGLYLAGGRCAMAPHRPRLTLKQILGWADDWHARTGSWPGPVPHAIPEAPGENWDAIQTALEKGLRGLPPGDSLFRLLVRHGRQRGSGAKGKEGKKP